MIRENGYYWVRYKLHYQPIIAEWDDWLWYIPGINIDDMRQSDVLEVISGPIMPPI